VGEREGSPTPGSAVVGSMSSAASARLRPASSAMRRADSPSAAPCTGSGSRTVSAAIRASASVVIASAAFATARPTSRPSDSITSKLSPTLCPSIAKSSRPRVRGSTSACAPSAKSAVAPGSIDSTTRDAAPGQSAE
jgi:hypothetical protein